jgi:spore coat protein A, manganese oxidase
MLTRRQVLKRGAIGGAALMTPSGLFTSRTLAQGRSPLKKFRTACPTPGESWPVIDLRTTPATTLNLKPFQVEVHPRFGPTTNVWGYEPSDGPAANRSTYLGPTLVAERGTPVDVTHHNQLPTTPLFPADPELVPPGADDSRINTHLHGGRIGDTEDGNPFDAYGDASGQQEVPPGDLQTMTYANEQGGTLLWYHDHALGITRTNVYAGLAGGYLLTEPPGSPHAVGNVPTAFDASDVPDPYAEDGDAKIPLHIPLVIQDKTLDADGQLVYPFPWVPEFFGDTCLVNGRAFPYLEVQPRRYRFTFLNGSQSRFYNLKFSGRVSITQIGVELGPIDSPVSVSNILIAPAERADVIVDFSKMPIGARLRLADRPLPRGVVSPTKPLGNCMEFRVVGPALDGPDPFAGPPELPGWYTDSPTPRPGNNPSTTSKVTLEEVVDADDEPVMAVVNGTPFMERDENGEMTDDPTAPYSTEKVPNGATVDWLYLNLTADSHPFHTHLAHFEVMERWTFDAETYLVDLETHRGGGNRAAGVAPRPPVPTHPDRWDPATYPDPFAQAYGSTLKQPDDGVPPEEKGPKDTVIANPGEITRIRLKFDLPTAGPGTEKPARYVFHCHILEHEENEMMRPLLIT